MSYFDQVFDRIQFATNIRTQVQLADALCIKQSSISDAKKRDSVPAEWLVKLHDKFDLNIDWLRSGVGSKYNWERSGDNPGEGVLAPMLAEEGPTELPLADGEVVRVLSTVYDYREGGPEPDFSTHEYMRIPHQFHSEGLRVFYVDSGGMDPILNKGSYAGVTPPSGPLVSGDVYAILMPYEGVVFRRIMLDVENGTYILNFAKKDFPCMRLPAESLLSRIVGKLKWVFQRV